MKRREILLSTLLAAPTLFGETPAHSTNILSIAPAPTAAPAKTGTGALSTRLTQELRAALPAYDPSQHVPPPPPSFIIAAPEATPSPSDPDVLQLPKMTVRERMFRYLDPDQMISRDNLLRRQKNDYVDSLEADGTLNRVLNNLWIPLFSPSVKARAQARYEAKKWEQLGNTVDSIRRVDPDAATTLTKELTRAIDRPSLGNK